MLLQECAIVGLKELWANKVRSFLSLLGIIVGIVALIVMMAVMAGIERTWMLYINERGGLTKATVQSKTPTVSEAPREDLKKELTLQDAALIKALQTTIRYVSAQTTDYKEISRQGRAKNYVQVIGAMPDLVMLDNQRLVEGRFITAQDVEHARNVCVIGSEIKKKLFLSERSALGRTIEVGGLLFDVVGVLRENKVVRRKKNIVDWKNELLYVPVSVFSRKFDPAGGKVEAIHYAVRHQRDIGRAKKEVMRVLTQSHGVEDIEINTMEEKYLESKKSFNNMKLGFSLIAGISLIVGGIGIMNIMIASIAQRVMEIGIRKAVGAKRKDILVQFLLESVIVSVLGGCIGILGSFGVVWVLGFFSKESRPIVGPDAVAIAFFFSIIVGIAFGMYPALKASKLDPIQALRYQ